MYWKPENYVPFDVLLGKTIEQVIGMHDHSEEVIIKTTDGETYRMFHWQDCCESVMLEEVIGEPGHLVGLPITMAEEVNNVVKEPRPYAESYTWTFYKLATARGYVTLRWYGESNGYYSESVDFIRVTKEAA